MSEEKARKFALEMMGKRLENVIVMAMAVKEVAEYPLNNKNDICSQLEELWECVATYSAGVERAYNVDLRKWERGYRYADDY